MVGNSLDDFFIAQRVRALLAPWSVDLEGQEGTVVGIGVMDDFIEVVFPQKNYRQYLFLPFELEVDFKPFHTIKVKEIDWI